MWDLPPSNPDFYIQQDKINNPPIEHRLDSYPKMSKKVWEVVIEVKNWMATVFKKGEIKWETQKETGELNEEFKKQFVKKLKQLPDYEGSKLKEVVESWKLEIVKTEPISFKKQKLELQIRDSKYALYEEWWNLLYFVELNWEKYFHVDRVRKWIAWWTIENILDLYFWWKQVLENWIYNIYIWDKKININSEEYRKMLLICWESVIQLKKELEEVYKQKIDWGIDEFKETLNKIKNNEHIQKAIENWNIKIFEIPWQEVLAISVWKSIDYLYNKDWTLLFSFKWKRDWLYSAFYDFLIEILQRLINEIEYIK